MRRLFQHALHDRFCAIPIAKPTTLGLQTFRVASLLVGLLGVLGWSASGAAAMLTVNVLTDTGGERCPTTCSLRAALATARAGDEIQFSVTGTILLSQGQLVVDKNVTITGPGASRLALDGNQASRVLQVNSGVTGTISGLTIQNGFAPEGGGIFNDGDLTLTHCTLSGNSASPNGAGGRGGGIYNTGTLTLTHSTLSGNGASPNGVSGHGGGIYNTGTLTLTHSTLSDNNAGRGGGIANDGDLMLTNCTLSGNSGGFSTNPFRGGRGGGIENTGALTLTHCTLSGNSAGDGGGIYGGGIYASSIIANSPDGGNCSGTITSHGDNLSSDATCVATDTTLNDRNMTDPLLDPSGLQDNGGPTLTIALQPGSPAIDAVRYNTCPPPATDQRGVSRPVGARCDIGAIEFEGGALMNVNDLVTFTPLPATFTTTADPAGCPAGFAGKFHFAAKLTAKPGSPSLTDLRVQVQTLTNGNLLQNADSGPGGAGAILTVPQADAFADGILSPEESVDVPFVVCLQQRSLFRFFVDVLGDTQ